MRYIFLHCCLLRKVYFDYYFVNEVVVRIWLRQTLTHDLNTHFLCICCIPKKLITWYINTKVQYTIIFDHIYYYCEQLEPHRLDK